MIFCNPNPIAAASYLSRETVASAIQAFAQAVNDLTQLGHDLSIDFGFVTVKVAERGLTYKFSSNFHYQVNDLKFEDKIKKATTPTDSFWKTTKDDRWSKSTLSGLFKKPDGDKVQTLAEKTLALKILSLDLNSAEKTGIIVANKNVSLPKIEGKKSSV